MKVKTLLIAAVMVLALSAAAFAQVTFQVSSQPTTTVTTTGNTEPAGPIVFTVGTSVTTTIAGTITIDYPRPITVVIGSLSVTPGAGNAGGDAVVAINPSGLTNSTGGGSPHGLLVLAVPAGHYTQGNTYTVAGVRLQIAGNPVSAALAVNISTDAGVNISAGQTAPVVINGAAAAITIDSKASRVGSIDSLGAAINPRLALKEGYLNAYGATDLGMILRITLSAAPPAGYTIAFPLTVNTTTGGGVLTAVSVAENTDGSTAIGGISALSAGPTINSTTSSAQLKVYYQLTSASAATSTDTATVEPTLSYDKTTYGLPAAAVNITWTVTLAPIQAALTTTTPITVPTGSATPRYELSEIASSVALLGQGTGTGVLLIPYALTNTALNYATGLAIANTTVDPGAEAMFGKGTTIQGAVPQSGTVTFHFYQQQVGSTAPAHYSYTTGASSPGTGLDATGKLPAGSTYVVLLNEITAKITGMPADFSGYVVIITNFGNVHGEYFISNFSSFTHGALMLVVNSTAAGPGRSLPELLQN